MNLWVKLTLVLALLAVGSAFSIMLLLRLYRQRKEGVADDFVYVPDPLPEPHAETEEVATTTGNPPVAESQAAQFEAAEPEPDAMASRLSRLKQRGQMEETPAAIPLTQPVLVEQIDALEEQGDVDAPSVEGAPDARSLLKARLKSSARKCIRFRRDFPIQPAARSTSFFGGTPFAPPEFLWPRSATTRLPLTFMGQLDCRDLPRAALPPALPDHGIFYFFADLVQQSGQEDPGFVLHMATKGASLYDHPVPDFAPRCYGEGAPVRFPWIALTKQSEDHYPRSFPKTVVKPILADSWSATSALAWPEDAAESSDVLRAELVEEGERALYGPYIAPPEEPGDLNEVVLPFEGFPSNWRGVSMAAGQMLSIIAPFRSLGDASVGLLRQANDWVEKARTHKPSALVDAEQADAFRAWLNSLGTRDDVLKRGASAPGAATLVTRALAEIAPALIEETLRDPASAPGAIPVGAVAALRHRHLNPTAHQMFGTGILAGGDAAPYVDRYILLLQIAADPALHWQFGENAAWQYWIAPSDLAAHKFDRTLLLLATG